MAAFTKGTTKQIANNRLQLKALIFIVRHLAFQAIAFRGQEESLVHLIMGTLLNHWVL